MKQKQEWRKLKYACTQKRIYLPQLGDAKKTEMTVSLGDKQLQDCMKNTQIAATVSQDPRTCFAFVRIREKEEEARSYMWVMRCVVRLCRCVSEWVKLQGKDPQLSLQKSLSRVVEAVLLSPHYLWAQAGYRFLCAGWLCIRHQESAAQLWPAFLGPLPSKRILIGMRSTDGLRQEDRKTLQGVHHVEKTVPNCPNKLPTCLRNTWPLWIVSSSFF